ncbi:signaling lymphocytic activation molecule [Emydura macquarii macquarii]|uniref:signaling lymphocytic activation molecule n=1 Tax=Emydura macquarii macquarii TaxID=1129001 RepID=UPI00352B59FE
MEASVQAQEMMSRRQTFKYQVHCKQSFTHREMDCSACILLIISFCCAGGVSSGLETLVYGILGRSTLLSITPEFQNVTEQFSQAIWKRGPLADLKKKIIIVYSGNNYTNYMKDRIKFHHENFSLEILETRREDANHYEYTVIKGPEENSLRLRLEVYEQVSNPNIQIINSTQGNDSCTMTLGCTVERGDNVTYHWSCGQGKAPPLFLHNGSRLHLSLSPEESSFFCLCNASNRVSWQPTSFSSSVECSKERGGSLKNKVLMEYMVPIIVVLVLCAGGVSYYVKHKEKKKHSELKKKKETCTIYSQVQKVEKQKNFHLPPAVAHSDCTTIYVSATGLPPDTTQTQDPGPMTVYASVMPAKS